MFAVTLLLHSAEPKGGLVSNGRKMVLAELEVLNRRRLDVTVIVFNDASLTLIKLKQGEAQGGGAAVGYSPISFASIATAMGIDSATVRDIDEFRGALAQSEGRPFLIDVAINASDYTEVMKLARG